MNFLQPLKTLTLAVILSIGIGYAYAAWAPPTAAPTGGNAEAPVNVGGATQLKAGGLGINGVLRAYSNIILGDDRNISALSVGSFGHKIGREPSDGSLYIGGGQAYIILQNNVGIGVTNPAQKLDIQGGVKIATVSSLCTPAIAGTVMYDGKFKGCDGATWVELGGSGSSPPPPPPPLPTVDITVSDAQIPVEYSTTLSWNSTDAVSCVGSGAWSGGKLVNGSETITPGSSNTFTLTCTNASGSASDSVSVDVRQWSTVSGQGNVGESCRQWLERTGQAGIDGSPPRTTTISNGQIRTGECTYSMVMIYQEGQPTECQYSLPQDQFEEGQSSNGVNRDLHPIDVCINNMFTQTRR